MKKTPFYILVIFAIFLSNTAQSSPHGESLQKEFASGETKFLNGYYKASKKTFKGILKTLKPKDKYDYYLKVKVLIALGKAEYQYDGRDLGTIYQSLEEAQKICEKHLNGDQRAVLGLCNIAEAYLGIGDFIQAESMIGLAYSKNISVEKSTTAEIEITDSKLKLSLGYFTESYALAIKALPYQFAKIKTTYEVVSKGKTKQKKYKKSEYLDLQRVYAQHLNYIGKILFSKGAYTKADSALKKAEGWILDNMGKKDLAMVDNLFLQAQLFNNLSKIDLSIKLLSEAITLNESLPSERRYMQPSWQNLEMSAFQLLNLEQRGNLNIFKNTDKGDARRLKSEYHVYVANTSFYNKYSLAFLKEDVIEAKIQFIQGDYKRAEKLINKALNFEGLAENHPYRKKLREVAYGFFIKTEDLSKIKATTAVIDKLNSKYLPKDCPVYHKEQTELAIRLFRFEDQYKKAEDIFNNSFQKVVKDQYYPQHTDYLKYVNALTELYLSTEQFDKAETNTNEALSIAKQYFGPDNFKYADQLNEKAIFCIETGRYRDAEKLLGDGLRLFEFNESEENKQSRDGVEGEIFRSWIILDIAQNNFDNIKKYIKEYRKRTNVDKENKKDILDFAPYYIKSGDVSLVKKTLNRYKDFIVERYSSTDKRLIPIYLNLARVDLEEGFYTEAEKTMVYARKIISNIFSSTSLKFAEYLRLEGEANLALGDYGDATKALRKALEIQERYFGQDHLLNANTIALIALTNMYDSESGLTTAAQKSIEKQLLEATDMVIRVFGGDKSTYEQSSNYIEMLKNQAIFYLTIGNILKAEEKLEETQRLAQQSSVVNKAEEAELKVLLGRIKLSQNDFNKALSYFTDASSIYKLIYDGSHPSYTEALGYKGQVYYLKGDINQAINILDQTTEAYMSYVDKYFPYLSEKDKREFWFKKLQPEFEFYKTLAFQKPKNRYTERVYDHIISTKALLLSSSLKVRKQILNSGDSLLIGEYENWINQKEKLAAALSMNAEKLKEENINLTELQASVQGIEKILSEKSTAFKAQTKRSKYNWKDVVNALEENEYAVEIIRYRYFENNFSDSIIYMALILGADSKSPTLVRLTNGKDLEDKFKKYYRNAIKYKISDKESFKAFWEPIYQVVGDKSTVFLSGDGVYNEINVESLLLPDGSYVIDKNDIRLISNTKDLVAAKKAQAAQRKSKTALFMGNPAYYEANIGNEQHANTGKRQRIKQLPGAEEEIISASKYFETNGWDTETLIFETATEDTIKSMEEGPRIFHIATHGFFAKDSKKTNDLSTQIDKYRPQQNPLLKSGLILRNGGDIVDGNKVESYNIESGVLTAYEAMNLNFDGTELVVLSACETGRGETQTGEGVYGLQRAFIVAGAENVIMSLFKVNDEVTRELMNVFYEKWLSGGDKRKAFIEAKKEIRKRHPEPIYWGSFVMIGK